MESGHQEITMPATQADEYQEIAWGVQKFGDKFTPFYINRPNVGPKQVKFKTLYSGVCHTDLHKVKGHFGPGNVYPYVPGHEILGEVTEIGEGVTKFKVGDHVGVGCFVDSCMECEQCEEDYENYCDKGVTETYDHVKKFGRVLGNKDMRTWGGYSGSNVVHEHFCLTIPKDLPVENAAPILCAGITMYDPLQNHGFTTGKSRTVGIVAIGGLGTMGIKIAKALGHTVVAISTTSAKEQLAKDKGATHFVASKDPESIKAMANSCHIILNTVAANHDINTYMPLLKKGGVIVQIGAAPAPHSISQIPLMFNRQSISGSLVGGIKNTQEILDFCAKHQIWPDAQMIKFDQIDWAFEQLETNNKDGIRFVIDVQASIAAGQVPTK
jgi:uncharacterized zinc-type alcohol dehydrogenase-like protein